MSGRDFRLIFIRHGETIWNAQGRLMGRTDAPLSVRGEDQARALAPHVPDVPCVVRSPLGRAEQTAVILGRPDAIVDDRWAERDVGDWTGQLIDDLPKDEVLAWRAGLHVPPGGETWEQIGERIRSAIADLQATGEDAVLVIAHGGIIRSAMSHLLGVPRPELRHVGTGSLSVLNLAGPTLEQCGWVPDEGLRGVRG